MEQTVQSSCPFGFDFAAFWEGFDLVVDAAEREEARGFALVVVVLPTVTRQESKPDATREESKPQVTREKSL
eukprot:3213914-Rhodomonas_salina.3